MRPPWQWEPAGSQVFLQVVLCMYEAWKWGCVPGFARVSWQQFHSLSQSLECSVVLPAPQVNTDTTHEAIAPGLVVSFSHVLIPHQNVSWSLEICFCGIPLAGDGGS